MSWLDPYIGVPFKDEGLDPSGWSCWGLCRWLLKEGAGIELPAWSTVSADEIEATMDQEAGPRGEEGVSPTGTKHEWIEVAERDARLFDLARMKSVYRDREGRLRSGPVHVGMVVARRRLIHVEEGVATVCLPFDHPTIRGRITKIYRHRSLA